MDLPDCVTPFFDFSLFLVNLCLFNELWKLKEILKMSTLASCIEYISKTNASGVSDFVY